MEQKRQDRKREHITHAVALREGPLPAGWDDIHLVHQALLKHNFSEIDTRITLFGKKLAQPLLINALTGGAPGLERINSSLARVARETGIALAVGSQTAGVRDKEVRPTYEVVREIYPEGLILANVSALAKPAEARAAVEMIGADALQLHLNGAQELLMTEGDRDFSGMALNIAKIMEEVQVPCLVKEVGFGISRETAQYLFQLGVRNLDISGAGGTNFAAIELLRAPHNNYLDKMRFWGLPAACSLLEVCDLKLPLTIIASGGIHCGLDMAKALAIGADAAAMAGHLLKILVEQGEEALLSRIYQVQEELKMIMLMVGAKNVTQLSKVPLVISGLTNTWCTQRGIETSPYAKRGSQLAE